MTTNFLGCSWLAAAFSLVSLVPKPWARHPICNPHYRSRLLWRWSHGIVSKMVVFMFKFLESFACSHAQQHPGWIHLHKRQSSTIFDMCEPHDIGSQSGQEDAPSRPIFSARVVCTIMFLGGFVSVAIPRCMPRRTLPPREIVDKDAWPPIRGAYPKLNSRC